MERIAVELFKGRHKFEDIEGCIFNKELRDVKNMYYMQMSIKKAVDALMKRQVIREYRDIELDVYLAGRPVALVEVINFCSLYDIKLVLYHYDKYTKTIILRMCIWKDSSTFKQIKIMRNKKFIAKNFKNLKNGF